MTDMERFIQDQLAALGDLGLSVEALAREEALLRSGFAASGLLEKLLMAGADPRMPRCAGGGTATPPKGSAAEAGGECEPAR